MLFCVVFFFFFVNTHVNIIFQMCCTLIQIQNEFSIIFCDYFNYFIFAPNIDISIRFMFIFQWELFYTKQFKSLMSSNICL